MEKPWFKATQKYHSFKLILLGINKIMEAVMKLIYLAAVGNQQCHRGYFSFIPHRLAE